MHLPCTPTMNSFYIQVLVYTAQQYSLVIMRVNMYMDDYEIHIVYTTTIMCTIAVKFG